MVHGIEVHLSADIEKYRQGMDAAKKIGSDSMGFISSVFDKIKSLAAGVWDALKSVFSGIGDAFKGTFSSISDSASSAFQKVAAMLPGFHSGLDQTKQKLDETGDSSSGLMTKIGEGLVATFAAAAVAVAGFTAKGIIAQAALGNLSISNDIAASSIGKFQDIAARSGVSLDQLAGNLAAFQKAMKDAATSGDNSVFDKLGVKITDSNGALRDTATVAQEAAGKVANLGSEAAKYDAAAKLGFGGKVQLLEDIAHASTLASDTTDEQAAAAVRLGKIWHEILPGGTSVWQDVSKFFANNLTPAVTAASVSILESKNRIVDAFNQIYGGGSKFQELGDRIKNWGADVSNWFGGVVKSATDASLSIAKYLAAKAGLGNINTDAPPEGAGFVPPQTPLASGSTTTIETDASKKQREEYEALAKSIKEKIAIQQQEGALNATLTDGQRTLIKVTSDLAASTGAFTDSQKAQLVTLLNIEIAQEKANQAKADQRALEKKNFDEAQKWFKTTHESAAVTLADLNAEIANGSDLTAEQKARIKVMTDLDDKSKNLTAAQIAQIKSDQDEIASKQKIVAQTKAEQDAKDKLIASARAEVAAAQQQTESLGDQVKYYGLTEEAVLRLKAAELTRQLQNENLGPIESGRIQGLLDETENQITLQHQLTQMKADTSFWTGLESTAHTVFTSITDTSKDAWTRLRDSAKTIFFDWLYQQTLKKWIINIGTSLSGAAGVSGIAGAAESASGVPGAAGAGQVGGLIGAANAASSAYKLVTGGIASNVGGAISSFGNAVGSQTITQFGSGVSGQAAQLIGIDGATMDGAAAAGSAFTSAVTTALPWVAAAVVAYKAWGALFEDGPESDTRLTFASNNQAGNISINERGNEGQNSNPYIGGYGTSSLGTFGVSSSFWTDTNSAAVQALIKNVATTDDALASYLTTTEKTAVTTALSNHTDTVHTGAEGSDQNASGQLDSVFADRINTILNAVEPGLGKLEDGFKGTSQELATEATALLAYRNSLKDSGQAIFGAQVTLEQIAALKTPTEATSAALTRVTNEFNATNAVAAAVGKDASTAFGAVGLASEAARAQLITLAGGVSTLTTETASYSQNYLTSAEQLAPTLKAVTAAMDAMGLSGVTTRDQFKAVVDSLDLSTTAGATEYAQLMALSDAFAQVHDATVVATKSEADIASERADLQDQLNKLTLTSTQLTELQRDAIDDSNKALFDQVQATQAAKDAAAAAADDQAKILDQQAQLYAATGDAAGAAAVLEQQHEAALVGLSPALAAATQATWDAQAAATAKAASDKAAADALATSNSLLDIQAQIYQVTGNKAGAAAVLEQQHIAALAAMDPALRGATEQLWAVQAAATAQAEASAQQAAVVSGYSAIASALADTAKTATAAAQALRDYNNTLSSSEASPLAGAGKYTAAKQALSHSDSSTVQANVSSFLTTAKLNDTELQYARDFAWAQSLVAGLAAGQDAAAAGAYQATGGLAELLAKAGIGAHANGGIASGLSLVGEQGPEFVDFAQPARVYTASQTRAAMSGGDNSEVKAEIKLMREQMKTALDAIAAHTKRGADNSKVAADVLDGAQNGRPLATAAA